MEQKSRIVNVLLIITLSISTISNLGLIFGLMKWINSVNTSIERINMQIASTTATLEKMQLFERTTEDRHLLEDGKCSPTGKLSRK